MGSPEQSAGSLAQEGREKRAEKNFYYFVKNSIRSGLTGGRREINDFKDARDLSEGGGEKKNKPSESEGNWLLKPGK